MPSPKGSQTYSYKTQMYLLMVSQYTRTIPGLPSKGLTTLQKEIKNEKKQGGGFFLVPPAYIQNVHR